MAVGRPTKMTVETVAKLEQAFLLGCTDDEACLFANINRATLYRYCEDNLDFRDRKEVLKTNPVMKARKVIVDALDDNDTFTAHKVIDRKEGGKLTLAGDADKPLVTKTVVELVSANNTDA